MPSEGEDADEARHDGRPQEVLHGRGAVRVPIKHLRREDGLDHTEIKIPTETD